MGIFSEAGEAIKDLFRHDRVTVIDEHGNEVKKIMKPEPLANPIRLLRMLTWKAWLFYVVGLAAWTVDGYDFHSVSLSVTSLASFYDVSKTQVTTSITLTLLFRSLGAALFGVAGDYYGRKWPMAVNMFIIGALQIATIYAQTYNQFLGVRALFGIGMGGVWGNATAMSLESVPVEARGLLSGILQQGYSLGYLLAAVFTLAFASEGTAPDSYKILFWIGAGASFAVGLIRMCFPESQIFIEAKKDGKRGGHTKLFFSQFGEMVKTQWKMIIYCVVLMALFNLFSHTTQDAYPTFLISGKGFKRSESAKGAIYAKCGAVVGGTFVGYVSQTFGRRRSIVLSALICAAVIPAWILPNTQGGLAAGSFMLQFMVQGAWGVVPVHLNELSPPAFRSSFPGIAYQLGNAISSPSAEIVTALSAKYRVTGPNGRRVEGFGPVMGIATAIIAISLAVWTAVGRENRASHFERGGVAWDEKHQHNRELEVPKDDVEAGSSKESHEKQSVEVTHSEQRHDEKH